jgi:DNA polymerase-3 subunit delta'
MKRKNPGAEAARTGAPAEQDRLGLSPWLDAPWRELQGLESRHAHAVAIQAMPGIGVDLLIEAYIRARFCEVDRSGNAYSAAFSQPEYESAMRVLGAGLTCGVCRACRWLGTSSRSQHPDLRRLRPEADEDTDEEAAPPADISDAAQRSTSGRDEEGESPGDPIEPRSGKAESRRSREIRIEQIRAIGSFLQTGSHRGRGKVVWIQPAEAMHLASANALLKALEEPAAGSLFILSCENLTRLMPTIRSRCVQIRVQPPTPAQARAALSAAYPGEEGFDFALGLSGHAPWGASKRIRDSLLDEQARWLEALATLPEGWFNQLAEAWAQQRPLHWFEVLERWSVDLLCCAYNLHCVYFPQLEALAVRRAAQSNPGALLGFQDSLGAMKRLLNHPLNPRLFAESALIRYGQACAPVGGHRP